MKAIFPAEVERLWKLGFAIHWLKPKSKMPVASGWTTGERATMEELNATFRRSYNYGVRLGSASRVAGAFLAIVDVDVKSDLPADRREAIARTLAIFPQLKDAPHLLSGRGNGSRHYYVRVAEPVKGGGHLARSEKVVKVKMPSAQPSKREAEELTDAEIAEGWRLRAAWEVSLLCEGQQAVLVGSIHPDTGTAYAWGKAVNGSGKDMPMVDPTPKGETAIKARLRAEGDRTHLRGPERAPAFEFDDDVKVEDLPLSPDRIAIIRDGPRPGQHVDRSAKIFELCIVLAAAKVDDKKILSLFTDRDYFLGDCAYEHAKTNDRQKAARWVERYCLRKAKSRVDESLFDNVEEVPEPTDEWIDEAVAKSNSSKAARKAEKKPADRVFPIGCNGEPWWDEISLKMQGASPPIAKCTLANISTILRHRAPREDFVRYEEFSNRVIWNCSTPWGIEDGAERSAGMEDAVRIKEWLAAEYKIEPSNQVIDEALMLVSLRHKHHVVREYLDALEWDGVDRIERAFRTYLGADMQEPYLSDVSRKFFLACAKRIYEPGCKFDHVVVLEGKQGIGKSTFGNILAGDAWFMDGLPNFQDKDAALNLVGIWICELGELAAVYKSANESTKAFVTRRTDKVRPPYGQRRIDYPRATVFIGSTDKEDYLTDAAGNRRFWPVRVKQCDFAALKRDRDQLWAEAVWRYYFAPERLFLENGALHQAKEVQELRRIEDEGDSMRELFASWLETQREENADTAKLSITELFRSGPFFGRVSASRGNTMRAGDILREFGYEKKHTERGNLWVRKKGYGLRGVPRKNGIQPGLPES